MLFFLFNKHVWQLIKKKKTLLIIFKNRVQTKLIIKVVALILQLLRTDYLLYILHLICIFFKIYLNLNFIK